ncbi:MAG: hypothetical protein MPJ78_12630 [Hyphomicrobiaceae bacterium]|nr:hypothetical protein [Hyphomicrobiaceae bacterium]
MKIAVAAGALAALTAVSSPAMAKDHNFSLTIGGPEGYITIGGAGRHKGPEYGSYSYGGNYQYPAPGYGYGYGYGQGYGKLFNLREARAYGHCMTPRQIRRKLRYEGWRGFNVVKMMPRIAVVRSYRHGTPYRLKVDRCNGQILKAKPKGGYPHGGYW